MDVEKNNPKKFWDIIQLKEKDTCQPESSPSEINALINKYHRYYIKLLVSPDTQNSPAWATVFQSNQDNRFFGSDISVTLNSPFSEAEIREGAKSLKNGKAAGIDKILYEFIKFGCSSLAKTMKKLFNFMLSAWKYPSIWSVNILQAVHKGGDKKDLDNYRGISISSCFAKFFGLLLNKRLEGTIKSFKLIGESQIGFSREARTRDHIFVVNTLINKVVRFQSKKPFTAFIDFRKAFDKVDRKFLLLKLWSFGIDGPFLDTIKSMYENVQQRVRVNDSLIEPILSNVGLKQGCNLSPTLFKLFIEDLKLEFGPQCDPVRVGNYAVNHLLYADDLSLLSQSAEGLQLTLDS